MQTTSKNNPSRTSASVATVNAQGIKLSVQIFLMAVSFLCLAASCGGDDDPEASEPAGSLQLTDKGYTDGLLYYNITSQSTNEVAIIGAESTAVNVVTPTHVVIDGKTFSCTKIENQAFFEYY